MDTETLQIFITMGIVFGLVLVSASLLVRKFNSIRARNLGKSILDTQVEYTLALEKLSGDSLNSQLRAMAVEKGHLYYQYLGIKAQDDHGQSRLAPQDVAILSYVQSYEARNNRVQADIEMKIKQAS